MCSHNDQSRPGKAVRSRLAKTGVFSLQEERAFFVLIGSDLKSLLFATRAF